MGIFSRRNKTSAMALNDLKNNNHFLDSDNDSAELYSAQEAIRKYSSAQQPNSVDENAIHGNRSRSNSRATPSLRKKSSKLSLISLNHDEPSTVHQVRKTQSKLHNLVATASNGSSNDVGDLNQAPVLPCKNYDSKSIVDMPKNYDSKSIADMPSSSSTDNTKLRPLNFGILNSGPDSGVNSAQTNNNSSEFLYNMTSNNTASTNITSNTDVKPKRVQRKISINELSHIRSHSLSANPHDALENEPEHNLASKKSFTFFNKLIKPKHKPKDDLPGPQNHTISKNIAERYASNQNMEIVQTKLNFLDPFTDNEIHKRNMNDLNINTEARLSTLTEDSFYFNSRTPTTPVYGVATSSSNLKEKPLPDVKDDTLNALNMLDLPPSIAAKSRSASISLSSINKDLPQIPQAPEHKPQEHKSKLLPAMGDDDPVAPVISVTKHSPTSEQLISPRSIRSPNGSRLSKIINKISFSNISSPKNRSSMISLKNSSHTKSNDFSFVDDPSATPNRVLNNDNITPIQGLYTPQRPGSDLTKSSLSNKNDISSDALPTPTIDRAPTMENASSSTRIESPVTKEPTNKDSPTKRQISPIKRSTPSLEKSVSPIKGQTDLLADTPKNSKGIFRSPSKRLSKRLSGKFSSSPLISFYKSASPKRFSQSEPHSIDRNVLLDDKLEAINVPEFQAGNMAYSKGETASKDAYKEISEGIGQDSEEKKNVDKEIGVSKDSVISKANILDIKDCKHDEKKSQLDINKSDDNNMKLDETDSKASKDINLNRDLNKNVPDDDPVNNQHLSKLNVHIDTHDSELSPIEEVDSPDSARGKFGLLSGRQREMSSISSSLNKLSASNDMIADTQSPYDNHQRVSSDASFHTTDTTLPSPTAALYDKSCDKVDSASKSSKSLLSNETENDLPSPTNSPYLSQRHLRTNRTQSKLSEEIDPSETSPSNKLSGNNSTGSVNVTVRPRKAKSPRAITSYQEDFLTRSAKTLSTILANRKTLRPISAAFRTPLLPDYEDEFTEQTPILPTDGKNNSQITLNFEEKALVDVDDAVVDENEEALVEEDKSGIKGTDVTKEVPLELAEILQKEGFNEFMSPKSIDINYENFIRSGESSPSSEYEFASFNDYKKENKKLNFELSSTPIEMSKDPIFANILSKNRMIHETDKEMAFRNKSNEGTPIRNENSRKTPVRNESIKKKTTNNENDRKTPVKTGETTPLVLKNKTLPNVDLTVAPSQPKYPAPTPNYHPTITEEPESDGNNEEVIIGIAGVAQNIHNVKMTRSLSEDKEFNPFLEEDVKSSILLPKKSSQLSLNKILHLNNAGSTASDLGTVTHSNSSRTLTKGAFSPSASPYKTDKATLVKRSNSLRLMSWEKTPVRSKDDLSNDNLQTAQDNPSLRSPESIVSGNGNTTDSIYQDVYNLKSRDSYKSDLSLNTMKKSPSVNSLDLKGRHRSRHYSSNLHTDSSINLVFENEEKSELAALFVKAIHSFDLSLLTSEDTAVCLSFEKDDIAFVYNIDESGWGEVVLLSNLSKGWVPMNYFRAAVDETATAENAAQIAESRRYLKPLFIAAAEFLLNPQEVPASAGLYTFSARHVNDIRDGVKLLLQYTDCLSRTAPVVHGRPVVRRVRKALLADWYTLMSKAEKYRGTTSTAKIDFLKALVYKVLIKALAFLDIWGHESESYERERAEIRNRRRNRVRSRRRSRPDRVVYLERVPFAAERLTEVKRLLFQYLAVILGRLDVVENNLVGCELLESVVHQVILLLRELLFIGKSATIMLNAASFSLDSSLDSLLAYVGDLVTSVKHLVAKAEQEDADSDLEPSVSDEPYVHSKEGARLVRVVAQMVVSVATAMRNCQRLLQATHDFQLNIYRKYPDFERMRTGPDVFVRRCVAMLIDSDVVAHAARRSVAQRRSGDSFRYAHIRGGAHNGWTLTPDGLHVLSEYLGNARDSCPVSNKEYDTEYSSDTLQKEVVYDDQGNVLGASFKALVFLLANERSRPTSFFVATFFMSFRNFATTKELLHELIKRFDVDDREKEFLIRNHTLRVNETVAYDSRLTKRRKTILSIIQVWLESYWDYEHDFPQLATLVNFLNEGVSRHLPEDSFIALEVCARLAINHPLKKETEKHKMEFVQLISRRIGLPRKNSVSSSDVASLSSASSVSSLVLLNVPLNFSNYHLSAIMTKNQVSSLEKSVMVFRNTLQGHWPVSDKEFQPIGLSTLIEAWFHACKLKIEPPAVATELTSQNALDVAKQLTHIESSIFLAIQPEELLDNNFREKRIHLQKSPNIERSVLFTNLLSDLVIDTILSPGTSMKSRAVHLKHWLKIALACYQLRNYNSVAAIMTILQSSAISRLDKLWASLSNKYTDTFDFLVKIINPDKNYKVYRNLLKPHLSSEDRKSALPIVPYINLFLQDIIFAADGNRSKRLVTIDNQEHTLINFDKYTKIVYTVSELEFFQVNYPESETGASTSSLTSPVSKTSVFSFSPNLNSNTDSFDTITPNPVLEEFILFKLWATHQYNLAEDDRFWKYSLEIQPQVLN